MSPTGSGEGGEAPADGAPSDNPPAAGESPTDGSAPSAALRVVTIEEGSGEEGVRLPAGLEEGDQTGPELMEAWKSEMVSQLGGGGRKSEMVSQPRGWKSEMLSQLGGGGSGRVRW